MSIVDQSAPTLGLRLASFGAVGLVGVLVLVVAVRSPVAAEGLDEVPSASSDASDDDASPRGSARPAGSAAPSAKSSASKPSGDGAVSPVPITSGATSPEARATMEAFEHALDINDLKGALAKLKHLLELDAEAPRDDRVRAAIVELTGRIMLVVGPEPDEMFDLIVNHMGTTGIDILYQLMTTKGGSRAANVATKLLEREDVRNKGTDALRLAYGLRTAKSCDEKKALFPAVRDKGDGRSLGQLYLLNRRCGRRGDPICCLNGDDDLKATIEALQKRGFQ